MHPLSVARIPRIVREPGLVPDLRRMALSPASPLRVRTPDYAGSVRQHNTSPHTAAARITRMPEAINWEMEANYWKQPHV